ncbi:Uncharacterised protein [Escherichia coli]|uniref:Uncharacterized protein n=1 Tax=Escherichia coli TaxID=562 RepID=A0A3S4NWI6_ECOLX|nr:Uncharacterised protein [Escherichia coli]
MVGLQSSCLKPQEMLLGEQETSAGSISFQVKMPKR